MNDASTKPLTDLQTAKLGRVIATTQRLLSMRAIEDIRVEDIAAESRVAIASLYKRFGTKGGLIAAALVNYFEDAVSSLITHHRRAPLSELLYAVDATVSRILLEPEFARALMSIYFRAGHQNTTTDALIRRIFETYLQMLVRMRARNALAEWADLDLLGAQICDRQFGIVANWCFDRFPNAELGNQMRLAVLTILRSASIGPQACEIDRKLAQLHRTLSRKKRVR